MDVPAYLRAVDSATLSAWQTGFRGTGQPYEGLTTRGKDGQPRWNNEIMLVPHMLKKPFSWKRSRRIFVNSMSDLFHEKVPFDYIQQVFDVMRQASWHEFQILTKRAERLAELAVPRSTGLLTSGWA